MQYVEQLLIKKSDKDNFGNTYLKVYIPKYIEDQLDILLNNRTVRFTKKCISKINNVKRYKNKVTVVTNKTINIDILNKKHIVNMLLGKDVTLYLNNDDIGRYWFMVTNTTGEDIIKKIEELDVYFKNLPLIKEKVVVEYPIVRLSDLNKTLIYDNIEKELLVALAII